MELDRKINYLILCSVMFIMIVINSTAQEKCKTAIRFDCLDEWSFEGFFVCWGPDIVVGDTIEIKYVEAKMIVVLQDCFGNAFVKVTDSENQLVRSGQYKALGDTLYGYVWSINNDGERKLENRLPYFQPVRHGKWIERNQKGDYYELDYSLGTPKGRNY